MNNENLNLKKKEIWGCQQGIRVAAFNVGKNSKFIYPGYFMLMKMA